MEGADEIRCAWVGGVIGHGYKPTFCHSHAPHHVSHSHVPPHVSVLPHVSHSYALPHVSPDLNLYPAKEWKEPGWDWCDNMDPHRELDGYSDADVPDPEKGQEG